MKRRVECRFSLKLFLKLICLSSVIVSANNSTPNDQVKTNSYTAIMVSTTTVPTTLGSPKVNEERTIQSMMMGMLDGKEKSWSHKKKGILGTHNLDIKLPAQESFFCKFIKKQSVVMFSFCMQNQGWGWKKKKSKKKAKKKAKKKKSKKKKGGGKKKKKGSKKGGWKKPKPTPGWKPETTTGWPEPSTKGWEPESTTKGWEPESTTKGWEPEPPKGWGEDDEWQEDDPGKKGESDEVEEDELGSSVTSQDEEYQPKKDYKGKVGIGTKAGKLKSAVTVSTSYLSEFDLDKWESSDNVKNNPEDIIHHHFYRDNKWE